jgi:hypothetical protein
VQQINIALIQEHWAFKGRVRGLKDGRGMEFYSTSAVVCSMDVVPILLKYGVNGEGRMVVACSACLMAQLNLGHLSRWQKR